MKPGVLNNILQPCFPSFLPRNYYVFLEGIVKAFPFPAFYFVLFKQLNKKYLTYGTALLEILAPLNFAPSFLLEN
jgi:hypothetical protein